MATQIERYTAVIYFTMNDFNNVPPRMYFIFYIQALSGLSLEFQCRRKNRKLEKKNHYLAANTVRNTSGKDLKMAAKTSELNCYEKQAIYIVAKYLLTDTYSFQRGK